MLLILYSIISHFERKGDEKTDSPLMDWMFLHRWLLHNFKAHSVFPLISIIKVHTSGENQIPHRTRNTLKAVHSFFQSILKEKKGSQRAVVLQCGFSSRTELHCTVGRAPTRSHGIGPLMSTHGTVV